MFSSPAVAGDTVLIGVLNGTLEARDLATGNVLWSFETETSKRNAGWMLTADRHFNSAFVFRSAWRERRSLPPSGSSASARSSPPRSWWTASCTSQHDGNLYALD